MSHLGGFYLECKIGINDLVAVGPPEVETAQLPTD